jgi:hypothetical protein
MLSPKLLILERNEYKGPFMSMTNNDETIIEPINSIIATKLSFNEKSPLGKWFK